jgi:hypothetical protein
MENLESLLATCFFQQKCVLCTVKCQLTVGVILCILGDITFKGRWCLRQAAIAKTPKHNAAAAEVYETPQSIFGLHQKPCFF